LAGDDLQDRLAGTIGETLKLEPGLSSTSFGAGASRPIIRGQGGDRVRVLTNGVGSIDASSASPDHAVAVEPAQAERIEVVRGAALLRYGSSGSGGIVNVIDGRIPRDMPDGQTDATVRIGASSVDSAGEVAASIDQRAGNLVFHLDGTYRRAEDYNIPVEGESRAQLAEEGEDVPDDFDENRTLENSFAETSSLTGGVSYVGDRGFFGVAVNNFNSTYGIPGGHGHEEEEGEEHEGEEEEIGALRMASNFESVTSLRSAKKLLYHRPLPKQSQGIRSTNLNSEIYILKARLAMKTHFKKIVPQQISETLICSASVREVTFTSRTRQMKRTAYPSSSSSLTTPNSTVLKQLVGRSLLPPETSIFRQMLWWNTSALKQIQETSRGSRPFLYCQGWRQKMSA